MLTKKRRAFPPAKVRYDLQLDHRVSPLNLWDQLLRLLVIIFRYDVYRAYIVQFGRAHAQGLDWWAATTFNFAALAGLFLPRLIGLAGFWVGLGITVGVGLGLWLVVGGLGSRESGFPRFLGGLLLGAGLACVVLLAAFSPKVWFDLVGRLIGTDAVILLSFLPWPLPSQSVYWLACAGGAFLGLIASTEHGLSPRLLTPCLALAGLGGGLVFVAPELAAGVLLLGAYCLGAALLAALAFGSRLFGLRLVFLGCLVLLFTTPVVTVNQWVAPGIQAVLSLSR